MRKLAWITLGVTYFLMVWGNLVSATGSGLGCPDWPLCHGTITPPARFEVIFEWGHRLIAAVAGALILCTCAMVWYAARTNALRAEVRGVTKAIAALLGLQISLGAVTVLLELSPAVSTIHLGVALMVFAGLVLVASVTTWEERTVPGEFGRTRRMAVATLGALFVQLVLGAIVRHTHAGLACPSFPACGSGFFPEVWTFETGLAFAHRWWGVLLIGAFAHLSAAARRESAPFARAARATLWLALLQVALGIVTVLSVLAVPLRGAHAALGYAIWGVTAYVAIRSGAFTGLWRRRPGEPALGARRTGAGSLT